MDEASYLYQVCNGVWEGEGGEEKSDYQKQAVVLFALAGKLRQRAHQDLFGGKDWEKVTNPLELQDGLQKWAAAWDLHIQRLLCVTKFLQ